MKKIKNVRLALNIVLGVCLFIEAAAADYVADDLFLLGGWLLAGVVLIATIIAVNPSLRK